MPPIDDVGAARARGLADLVAVHRIAGMNADADDVAGRDRGGIPGVERFIGDDRVAVLFGGRRREHVKPSRRNNPNAERQGTGVDEVNFH